MHPERWQQLQDVYFRALELPEERRRHFLDTTCMHDAGMRAEVESLLKYEDKIDAFLEPVALDLVSAIDAIESDETYIADDFVGEVIDDRYVVAERVGEGGMGVVYRADHRLLGTTVAIKRLSPEFRQRTQFRKQAVDEARRAVLLDHENVAQIKDVVEASDDVFIVMEFIDGQTLRDRLEQEVSLEQFLDIATQCAAALNAAHQKRIAHLDIKPANIMLTSAGRVKICDFGIARQLPAHDDPNSGDATWNFSGTPAYMAPEVLEGNQFDVRADVFSLGVVFYELLCNRHPFRSSDVRTTTNRILKDGPDPALRELRKNLPRRLVQLIDRMLAKDPNVRPAAGEVLHELKVIQLREKIARDLRRAPAEAFPFIRRNPKFALGIGAVLVVLVWGLIYFRPLAIIGYPRMPDAKQVAVLPFRVSANRPDKLFYARGVSEMLASRLMDLTAVPNLRIEPPSSIRENNIDTVQKARVELNVNVVVDGMFDFSGNQAVFQYSLIRTEDGKPLRWGTVRTENADDFAFIDDIIQEVAAKLEIELASDQSFASRDARALSLYREGMGFLSGYHNPENLEAAAQHFRQAVEIDNDFADAYAALGQAYWYKFQDKNSDLPLLEQSLEACTKADALANGNSDAQVCVGRVFQEKGDLETAIRHFRQAITYSAANDEAFQALGRALEEVNRLDEAEKEYLKAIELRPNYWGPQSWIAGFYFTSRHDYTKALDHYNTALSFSKENARVHSSMAGPFLRLGQYDMAAKSLLESARLRPWASRPVSNLGLVYLMWGKYDEALRELEKAYELENPGDLAANYKITGNLARVYQLRQQTDKAREMYELAVHQGNERLQIDPRDHSVHILLGRYHAVLGNTSEAKSHLEFALKARPRDAHYLLIAATAHVAMGEREKAMSYIEQAVELGYTDVQVQAERELSALSSEPRYIALMSSRQNPR